ncbi:Coenzyme F420 hydrogenase/dehydrogenase, beta subunit C-terminal domain [Vibrio parahaemolyticus]|uniref:Coenzyme F420 hydrogenase/dehydrogenase, beta subunit C-terminal domain n=1 Tax=Vibrio parahaemolyticus TaxID=670 RepID=UPI000A3907AC|nr:Coenzyme F420 hydrogenase/dehydrogenase, beta subunit C-terminal domain [Vibrio parahaemolyticus]EHH2567855.1 coenzyme F420 hydrogenase [Vibrio parahaemolyticus]OUJ36396.1 coenzyme F420 hydrogenase [Vibrio parahaemolyticus]
MKIEEFNEKKIYSEVSGVSSYLEPNIEIKMNKFGLYEETVVSTYKGKLNPKLEKVLPYLSKGLNEDDLSRSLYSYSEDINYDKRLGYYKSLYVGHVLESDYRKNASSGGVGSWIFKELLEKKIIDGVIHVKENLDKTSEILFKYSISRSVEEIRSGAKTRYYPVELSEVLNLIKNNEGKYALIGIPSFIKAIRLLCLNDEIINERIVFTVGLICGHQKSSKFAEYMAWQVGIQPGKLKDIDFRYKLEGESADSYAIKMSGLINGRIETIIKPKNELDGQNWGLGYFKTFSSDFTDDVFNETADLVIGDAWLPKYTNDHLGNNIIIARSDLADSIIKEAIETRKLNVDEVSTEVIFSSQAAHYRHTHDEINYRLENQKKKGKWFPKTRVSEVKDRSYLRYKVQSYRMLISSQSHIYYEKAVALDDIKYFEKKMKKMCTKYRYIYYVQAIKNKGIKGIFRKLLRR